MRQLKRHVSEDLRTVNCFASPAFRSSLLGTGESRDDSFLDRILYINPVGSRHHGIRLSRPTGSWRHIKRARRKKKLANNSNGRSSLAISLLSRSPTISFNPPTFLPTQRVLRQAHKREIRVLRDQTSYSSFFPHQNLIPESTEQEHREKFQPVRGLRTPCRSYS